MTVTHHPDARRFVIDLGRDGLAYLAYEPLGEGVVDLQHTIVPDSAQGRGVGSQLVEGAFSQLREQGVRVVPTCPFVAEWLGEHPEQRDIVASGE
jgi:uncharacterized protein